MRCPNSLVGVAKKAKQTDVHDEGHGNFYAGIVLLSKPTDR